MLLSSTLLLMWYCVMIGHVWLDLPKYCVRSLQPALNPFGFDDQDVQDVRNTLSGLTSPILPPG